MKNKKISALIIFASLMMSVFVAPVYAAEAEPISTLILSETFDGYDIDATMLTGNDKQVGKVDGVWTEKWISVDSTVSSFGWNNSDAQFGIVTDATAESPANKSLKVESKADHSAYKQYSVIEYCSDIMNTDNAYTISTDVMIDGNQAGVAIRFFVHNNGKTYYELYFPGYNGVTLADGEIGNANWVLRKCIDGTTTVIAERESIDHSRLTENNRWNVSINVNGGRISWVVKALTSSQLYNLGVDHMKYSGEAVDPNPFASGVATGLALAAGGQGGQYVYYDNVKIYETALSKNIITYDNFEAYADEDVNFNVMTDAYSEGTNRFNGYIGSKWSSKPFNQGGYGYGFMAGSAVIDVVAENIYLESGSATNKTLVLESRAVWDNYGSAVTLLHEGTAVTPSDDFTIKVDVNKIGSAAGHAIRFLAHTDTMDESVTSQHGKYMNSYYELYFPGTNAVGDYSGVNWILSKVAGGVRTELANKITNVKMIPENWYNVEVSYKDGIISWVVRDSTNAIIAELSDAYEDTSPFADTVVGEVHLAALGQYNQITLWDNFKISLAGERELYFSEKFDGYTAMTEYVTPTSAEDALITGTWFANKSVSGKMFGFDSTATTAVMQAPLNGTGNALAIEGRATYTDGWAYPTVYNSTISTEANNVYSYTFDMALTGGEEAGGGLRFNINGSEYYELYFMNGNGANTTLTKSELTKTDTTAAYVRTAVDATLTGSARIRTDQAWHRVNLVVGGGNISWDVTSLATGTVVQTGSYTDEAFLDADGSRVEFFGAGQRDQYIWFDNIYIECKPFILAEPVYAVSGSTVTVTLKPGELESMINASKLQIILAYYDGDTNELISTEVKIAEATMAGWGEVKKTFTANSVAGSYGILYILAGEAADMAPVWSVIQIE